MELTLTLLFFIGIASSIIGGIAGGGGGVIPFLFLTAFGIPTPVAIASSRVGAFGSAISSIYNLRKKIKVKLLIPLILLSVTGATIGSFTVINMNSKYLDVAVGVLLVLTAFSILIKKKGKHKSSKKKQLTGFTLYFVLTILSAVMGVASSLVAINVLVLLFGLSFLESNATLRVPWLVGILVSLVIYIFYGLVQWDIALTLFGSRIVGGYIGSKLALHKGEQFVKVVFVLVALGFAGKFLVSSFL